MDRHNNIPSATADSNITPLRLAFNAVISKIIDDKMPWQVDRGILMPVGLSTGKQISGINFMLLSNPGTDNRWATKVDLERHGLKAREGEEESFIIHWWKMRSDGSQDDVSRPVSTPVAVPVYHLGQVDHQLPNISAPDVVKAMADLEMLARNAGVHVVFDENDDELYLEDTINIDADNPSQENVGLLLAGLVEWACDEHQLNRTDGDGIRGQFLHAVTVSMLASEYAVPVPGKIRIDMANRKLELVAYLEANPVEVLTVAREAWEIRQHVNQFAPASEIDNEVGLTAFAQASDLSLPSSPKNLY